MDVLTNMNGTSSNIPLVQLGNKVYFYNMLWCAFRTVTGFLDELVHWISRGVGTQNRVFFNKFSRYLLLGKYGWSSNVMMKPLLGGGEAIERDLHILIISHTLMNELAFELIADTWRDVALTSYFRSWTLEIQRMEVSIFFSSASGIFFFFADVWYLNLNFAGGLVFESECCQCFKHKVIINQFSY